MQKKAVREEKANKRDMRHIKNMADINPLSITTLNKIVLNNRIKRQRLSDWSKKQDPTICFL